MIPAAKSPPPANTADHGAGAAEASRFILGMRVDAGRYDTTADRILGWAAAGESRHVCVATVHMVMEAHDDRSFQTIVNGADLVTADGMPLVWALRLLGLDAAERVCGPKLMPILCALAAERGIPIGLYGGAPDVLDELVSTLQDRWPALEIAYRYSPPFRPLTDAEEDEVARSIDASGARIVFVGIGCPKQERWMHRMRGRFGATAIGVGAAFDFIAGRKRQAPEFLMPLGLEWLFRLATEPRRLWRRYLYHNPRFVARFIAQLLRERSGVGQRPTIGPSSSPRRRAAA